MSDKVIWEGEYAEHPASVVAVGSRVVPRLSGQYAVNPQDREGIFVAALRGVAAERDELRARCNAPME